MVAAWLEIGFSEGRIQIIDHAELRRIAR